MTCVALSGCSCIAYTAAKLSINVSFALRVCTLVPCSSIIVYMQSILLIIMYIHCTIYYADTPRAIPHVMRNYDRSRCGMTFISQRTTLTFR